MQCQGHQASYTLFENAIKRISKLELKGKKNPYASANGYILAHLAVSGQLGIRVDEQARLAMIETKMANPYFQNGRLMAELEELPNAILENEKGLVALRHRSNKYGMSLKKKRYRIKNIVL